MPEKMIFKAYLFLLALFIVIFLVVARFWRLDCGIGEVLRAKFRISRPRSGHFSGPFFSAGFRLVYSSVAGPGGPG